MIIDCHQHIWRGRGAAGLIEYLDEAGIDRCWLHSWESIDGGLEQGYQHLSCADVISAHRQYPNRIIPFCAVDPRRADAVQRVLSFQKIGVRGYGELKIKCFITTPEIVGMLGLCGEIGFPVLVHLEFGSDPWYLGGHEDLIRVALALSKTIFIGHGPAFWAGPVDLILGIDNIYGDMSANSGYAWISNNPFPADFMLRNKDKLLYGTDAYDTRLLDLLSCLDLPSDVYEAITHINAEKICPI
jgi:predicted TIM-barrel fold metal-dependent hydrolase